MRISWRRVGLLLSIPLMLLGAAVVWAPEPERTAGSTRCLPIVGPRVRIARGLSAREARLTSAHEAAHAAQCRRDGFVMNYVGRLTRDGRLGAEVEAFCAEGVADAALGTPPQHVVARILDELEEGYPWFRGTSRREFLRALEGQCAELVEDASRRSSRPLA